MKATDRSTDAWFLNEDLGVYRYSRARQQDDFPNDPPTAYDTKAEAEAAADAMARQEGVTMKATATYTGPAGTTTATVETTSRDVLAHRLVRGALNAACPGLAYTATAGSDPTQGTSRSVSARVVRASEAQVEAARDAMRQFYDGSPDAPRGIADAVVAAGVDADEVTRLREHVASLLRGYTPTSDEAGVNPLTGDLAVDMAAYSDRLRTRAEAAEAELDRLAEVVARVERVRQRLLDPVQHVTEGPLISRIKAESWLRAALSGPTPATD